MAAAAAAAHAPFGCHISDVKRTVGGPLGYSLGKDMRALKKPPSLRAARRTRDKAGTSQG